MEASQEKPATGGKTMKEFYQEGESTGKVGAEENGDSMIWEIVLATSEALEKIRGAQEDSIIADLFRPIGDTLLT